MISNAAGVTRQPVGYMFPWQAMNQYNDIINSSAPLNETALGTDNPKTPDGKATFGGVVHVNTQFDIGVKLRNGAAQPEGPTINIIPGVSVGKNIIQSSTAQISADLIRTQFQGMAWVTDPSELLNAAAAT